MHRKKKTQTQLPPKTPADMKHTIGLFFSSGNLKKHTSFVLSKNNYTETKVSPSLPNVSGRKSPQ
jgi:hypothetical protein